MASGYSRTGILIHPKIVENVQVVEWCSVKKTKIDFGCVVTDMTSGIALHAVFLKIFIARVAHKIKLKAWCLITHALSHMC